MVVISFYFGNHFVPLPIEMPSTTLPGCSAFRSSAWHACHCGTPQQCNGSPCIVALRERNPPPPFSV